MNVLTEIEDAKLTLEKIDELNEKRKRLIQDRVKAHHQRNNALAVEIDGKIAIIREDIIILRHTTEYVQLKAFTQVVKAFLTPDQYKEAWKRAHDIQKHLEHFSIPKQDE